MTETAPPAPSHLSAPPGDELAWVAARLAHVGGTLGDVRAGLVHVRSTTWRSGAAQRFCELVDLLDQDLGTAAGLVAEAERALPGLAGAVARAEQVITTAGTQS